MLDVPESEEAAAQEEARRSGIALEPVHTLRASDGGMLEVPEGEMPAAAEEARTAGLQLESVRTVRMADGGMMEVPESEREEFLKAYRGDAAGKADREATRERLAGGGAEGRGAERPWSGRNVLRGAAEGMAQAPEFWGEVGREVGRAPAQFDVGYDQQKQLMLDADAALGMADPAVADAGQRWLEGRSAAAAPEPGNMVAGAVRGAAQLLGQQAEMQPRAVTIGAGVGLAAGAVTKGVAAGPAAGAGYLTSVVWDSLRQGIGDVYREARRQGVDHGTARVVALVASVPYAALNIDELRRFLPKAAVESVQRSGVQQVLRILGRNGAQAVAQAADEGGQEGIKQAAALVGRAMNGLEVGTVGEEAAGIAAAAGKEFAGTVGSFALLRAPGVAAELTGGVGRTPAGAPAPMEAAAVAPRPPAGSQGPRKVEGERTPTLPPTPAAPPPEPLGAPRIGTEDLEPPPARFAPPQPDAVPAPQEISAPPPAVTAEANTQAPPAAEAVRPPVLPELAATPPAAGKGTGGASSAPRRTRKELEAELAQARAEAEQELARAKEARTTAAEERDRALAAADEARSVLEKERAAAAAVSGEVPRTWQAVTPRGNMRVEGAVEVVDAWSVRTSSQEGFDTDLQPRGPQNTKMRELQRTKIAEDPDAGRLWVLSGQTDTGAPIVMPDGNAINNNRIDGLRDAYALGNAQRNGYRAFVDRIAQTLGIDTSGMQAPIIIRRVHGLDHEQAKELARLSNLSGLLQMTDAELAERDAADMLAENMLQFFKPDEEGNILTRDNQEFLSRFVANAEDEGLLNSQGEANDRAEARVRRAILRVLLGPEPQAYELSRILTEKRETLGLQRQIGGLMREARTVLDVARTRPTYDLTPLLAKALGRLVQWKQDGANQTIRQWLDQGQLFQNEGETIADELTLVLGQATSAKQVALLFEEYGTLAMQQFVEGEALLPEIGNAGKLQLWRQSVVNRDRKVNDGRQTELTGLGGPRTGGAAQEQGGADAVRRGAPGGDTASQGPGAGAAGEPAGAADSASGVEAALDAQERAALGMEEKAPAEPAAGADDVANLVREKGVPAQYEQQAREEGMRIVRELSRSPGEVYLPGLEVDAGPGGAVPDGTGTMGAGAKKAALPKGLSDAAQMRAWLKGEWAQAFREGRGTVGRQIARLVRRTVQHVDLRGYIVKSSQDAAGVMAAIHAPHLVESLRVVYLDSRNAVIEARVVSLGLLDAAAMHPREVLGNVPEGTVGIVMGHNHPSHETTPSAEDIRVTRQMIEACALARLPLVDHIIINGKWTSLREAALPNLVFQSGKAGEWKPRVVHRRDQRPAPAYEETPPYDPYVEQAPKIRDPKTVHEVRERIEASLEPDQKGKVYAVLLDTRNRMVAVQQFDIETSPEEIAGKVLVEAGRSGVSAFVVLRPGVSAETVDFAKRLVTSTQRTSINLLDVVAGNSDNASEPYVSLRESGAVSFVSEPRAAYGRGGTGSVREGAQYARGEGAAAGGIEGTAARAAADEAAEAGRAEAAAAGDAVAVLAAIDSRGREPVAAAQFARGDGLTVPTDRGTATVRGEEAAAAVASGDPEAEARWQQTRDAIPEAMRQERKAERHRLWWRAWYKARPELRIGKTRGIGMAQAALDALDFAPHVAAQRTRDIIESVARGLSRTQYEALRRTIVLREIIADVERGRYASGTIPLYGQNIEGARRDLARWEGIAGADERVRTALEKRAAYREALVKQAVEAELLPREALERPEYFHHMNIAHAQEAYDAAGLGSFGAGAGLHERPRGWQKARQGDYTGDYVTDYLTSEMEVLWQMAYDLEKKAARDMLQPAVDRSRELKGLARHRNYVAVVGGAKNFARVQQLRGEAAAIRAEAEAAGEPLDTGAKARLAQIGEEIWGLDPTMPYRQRMAIAAQRLQKALGMENGENFEEGMTATVKAALGMAGTNDEARVAALAWLKAYGDREAFMQEALGDEYRTWGYQGSKLDRRLYAGQGLAPWQPKEGHAFFMTRSLTDEAIEKAMDEAGASADREALREALERHGRDVMAVGAQRPEWIVPAELVSYLDGIGAVQRQQAGMVGTVSRTITRGWKWWVTLSPPHFIRFMANNMSGDAEFATTLALLDARNAQGWDWSKELRRAAKDAWRLNVRHEPPAGDLAHMQRHGAIGTAGSMLQLRDLSADDLLRAVQQRHEPGVLRALARLPGTYADFARDVNQAREEIVRIAVYRYYRAQMAAGRDPNQMPHASDGDQVAELWAARREPGALEALAGLLSRDAMIDYRHATQQGQLLRQHILPFWRWQEGNASRYAQLLVNEVRRGRGAGARAAIGAKVSGSVAWRVARYALVVNLFGAAVALWNRGCYPEEDELLRRRGYKGYLILGRKKDGRIRWIRMEGALNSILAWFGAEDAGADIRDVKAGQKTGREWAGETLLAPVQQAINQVVPIEKTAAELLLGRRLWPDVLHPSPIRDRAGYVAQQYNLDRLYNWLTDRPVRPEDRGIGAWAAKTILRYDDPGESAYVAVMGSMFDWARAHDRPTDGFRTTPRGDALYLYRKSLQYGDDKAAPYWLRRYLEAGGDLGEATRNVVLKSLPAFKALSHADYLRWRADATPRERALLDQATKWWTGQAYPAHIQAIRRMMGEGGGMPHPPPPEPIPAYVP
jgi:DNA repair protein RadC